MINNYLFALLLSPCPGGLFLKEKGKKESKS
jgi:hypothetical protein